MISQPNVEVGRQFHFWPILLLGVVAIKAVFSFALRPSFALLAYGIVVYFLLLLLSTVFALQNAAGRTLGSRMFWIFISGGCGLWALDQWLSVYYGVGLRADGIPDSSIADPALFLHIVPLMAALAIHPHVHRSDQKLSRASLNFLLLLFFWVFLYAYLLFPYQYLFPDAAIYEPRFTALYAVENAALLLALGILTFRSPAPWRSVYVHLFGASALYGVSSTLANIATDAGWPYRSIYPLAQTAAVCWFVWVPLRARQLPLAEAMPAEPDAGHTGFTALLAKISVVAIPLIGVFELVRTHESPGIRTFRLSAVLASVLFLALAVFLSEYLAKRDLILESRASKMQKKLSEDALVSSEDRYRELVEALPDAIFVVREERIVFVNPSAVRLLGAQRREQIVGKDLAEIIHPCSLAAIRSRIRDSYQTGGASPPAEHVLLAVDGSSVEIESTSIHVLWNGSPAIETIARDIRERKRAEQALQDSQAALARVARIVTMGELTASIAHEINQPLAAVATNASASLHWLAAQPPNLDEARKALTGAVLEANRASEVIARLRALLRNAPPPMGRLNVNDVIREVLALVRSELSTGGVTAKTKLATGVPIVLGDRVQLQQVVLNLIMNAIDAMSLINGRPRTLLVKSARHSEGALIRVQDSGKGLSAEQIPRIFDSFFTTKPEGIGMGLSISRSIVEAHGGRLWAAPGSPQGAVFRVILPKAGASA
jgi:PAS domain S-box-containing protein